jgi:hypothetical protein
MMNRMMISAFALMVLFATASIALAQGRSAPRNRAFDDIQRKPTTSPYLNLLNNQGTGVPNYQNLVRPQMEQRSINLQQSNAIRSLQQQTAQSAISTRYGNQALRPTGHRSSHMNFMNGDRTRAFYPALAR